jgi:PAS domain S-box-containing protein
MRLAIGKQANSGIVIAVVVALAILALSIWQYRRILDTGAEIRHLDEVLFRTEQASTALMQAQLARQNYELTRDARSLVVGNDSLRQWATRMALLKKLTDMDGEIRDRLDPVYRGKVDGEGQPLTSRDRLAQIFGSLTDAEAYSRAQIDRRRAKNLTNAAELQWALWALLAAVVVLAVAIFRKTKVDLERMFHLRQMRESEQRYRELFNKNPMPMWVFDSDSFQFLEANTAAIHHYGYTLEEFLAKTAADIRLNGDKAALSAEVEAVRGKTDGIRKGIRQHVKKSGEVIFVDIAWHNINYKNRHAVLALANDVTERIQLEEELNEQRLSRQKQITEAVIVAQEKERTEIGKELHDNVNQILGASRLYINTAMTDEEMRQELLERSTELVSNAINEIRKISKSLITPGLREIGLIESIEVILNDLRVAGDKMAIDLDLQNISEEQIEDRRKLTLFRIVQEQLNNIVKHSGATRALIRLSGEQGYIVLTVADNGVGFDVGRHRKGVGITNIISRTELFNGKVEIQSMPGEGCTLTVSLPM